MGAPAETAPSDAASPDVLTLLTLGSLEVVGRLTDASNVTLLGRLELDGARMHCIYKPIRGEKPLWDFPGGTLAYREVLAYRVSEVAGWHCVPTTVLRPGPLGEGMVQEWIGPTPDSVLEPDDDPEDDEFRGDDWDDAEDDHPEEEAGNADGGDPGVEAAEQVKEADAASQALELPEDLVALLPSSHVPAGWLPVFRALDTDGTVLAVCHADDPRLALIAGFDLVVNNADRKAPHLLPTPERRILGVDHGLTFHVEDKLRTILWGWAGEPLPAAVVDGLRRLRRWVAQPDDERDSLLTGSERRHLERRIASLLADPVFPQPPADRTPIPWPPL
jgi:hypothetical protein